MDSKKTSTLDKNHAAATNMADNHLISVHTLIYNALMSRIDPNTALHMSREELLEETENFVTDLVISQGIQLNRREQQDIALSIVYDMVGFGPLENLLQDDHITDIMVNSPDEVYVERRGKIEKTPIIFRDPAHVLQVAQRIANRVGRRVDESSPMVDARLPDGSRVNIIIPPVALNGTVISIRKFSKNTINIDTMVKQNNMSETMAEFLSIATTCRLNVIVSGGTGSGKTTLLNAISQMINLRERILTIEDAAELKLTQPHVIRLETRPPNIEGTGAVSIRDLVRNALRMRPDRIIVGEVRGAETVDMLQAMNTGHDGSMSTIHANRATEALLRLENMVAMLDVGLPSRVIRAQITGGVDIIVHIERMRDGVRRVTEIVEVTHMEGEEIKTQELFTFEHARSGKPESGDNDKDEIVKGVFVNQKVMPTFLEKARHYGVEQRLLKLMEL